MRAPTADLIVAKPARFPAIVHLWPEPLVRACVSPWRCFRN